MKAAMGSKVSLGQFNMKPLNSVTEPKVENNFINN